MYEDADNLNKWLKLWGTIFLELWNREIPSYHPKISEEHPRFFPDSFAGAWNWIWTCGLMM